MSTKNRRKPAPPARPSRSESKSRKRAAVAASSASSAAAAVAVAAIAAAPELPPGAVAACKPADDPRCGSCGELVGRHNCTAPGVTPAKCNKPPTAHELAEREHAAKQQGKRAAA